MLEMLPLGGRAKTTAIDVGMPDGCRAACRGRFVESILTVGGLGSIYVNVKNINMRTSPMDIAAKIDVLGKPAWIALMILGFLAFWPIGLGILAYLVWSGRMRSCRYGRWHHEGRERTREAMGRWWGGAGRGYSSGNKAFDEYREETLRRLEEEEREFRDFLDRLRQAKDKAEFDQFMSERGRRPPPGAEPQPQA